MNAIKTERLTIRPIVADDWQSICFSVKLAWQTRKRVLVVAVAVAVIAVLVNLVELYIAPEILSKVEQHASLSELLLTIGGFTGALFLLTGLESYLGTSRQPAEISVRSAIIRLVTRKTCETSYPNIRDPKVLRLKEQANEATSSNNEAAEHIWKTLTELLKNLIGFVIYPMLLTNLNVILILVVVLTSGVGFFVTRYINEWEVRHREEKEVCTKEINYAMPTAAQNCTTAPAITTRHGRITSSAPPLVKRARMPVKRTSSALWCWKKACFSTCGW